jgi:PAS domain S-box-containing protein
MRLRLLEWLTATLVIGFLFGFDYLRHFVHVDLLHSPQLYLISVVTVCGLILIFNRLIFARLEGMQRGLRQQNRRLAALNAVGDSVSRSLDLDALLGDALTQILSATGVAGGAVFLADPERLLVQTSPRLGAGGAIQLETFRGLIGRCVATNASPPAAETLAAALARQGLRLWARTPLRVKGAAVGCLLLIAKGEHDADDGDRQLVEAIGAQLGIAIENATLHRRVEQQASSLATLIESSANAIITLDLGGTIRSWNGAAERIYGWSRAEAVGMVIPMVPADLRDESRALMAQIAATGEPLTNFETRRLRKDGEQIPVMVTVSPVRGSDGSVEGILGISTDLRDRKRLERTMLRQQRDLAVLAERERLARALHDDVGQVLGYVNMQGQAIGELLAAGRAELAGRQLERMVVMVQEAHDEVRQQILDLRGVGDDKPLAAALEALIRRYQRHHDFAVELTLEAVEGLRLEQGAQTQLLHIVQEAIVNARKHARARLVQVRCARVGEALHVAVSDDGRGFERVDAERRSGHFGLRIMSDRAEEIGGKLTIESLAGGGTTVMVDVPAPSEEVAYAGTAG